MEKPIFLPAEWHPQSGVMVTWPHAQTDWAEILDEVEKCFVDIAIEILKREKLLVITPSEDHVRNLIPDYLHSNLYLAELPSNDTWARDHGPVTLIENQIPVLLDFKFNGWGLKFASDKDNRISRSLFDMACFAKGVKYKNCLNTVLEGGSIESDGEGTVLTTSQCLLSPNRNGAWSQREVEDELKKMLNANRILWIHHGYLAGDDTDSHIDTLARFCNRNTIAYVKCDDPMDEHFPELMKMEEELMKLTTPDGLPYHLVALPMADVVYDGDDRLPATYANFLIINGAVLVPAYHSPKDEKVKSILCEVFPDREIILIDCLPLIKQHGSLHCVTMQFPEGVL